MRWFDGITNQRTWVWANSRREWRTGKPGLLPFMGMQRVRHNWETEQQQSLESPSTNYKTPAWFIGFPGSSAGKESTCNAGDSGLSPGLGRSSREGIGYPLQNSCTSLVAQLVKNPSTIWETWVWSLGWEDPLKGTATHSSILAWRIQWTVIVHGVAKSWTQLNDFTLSWFLLFWNKTH